MEAVTLEAGVLTGDRTPFHLPIQSSPLKGQGLRGAMSRAYRF
jgi:hypothetical protein